MENIIDSELIVRIRRSDEAAFYLFCNRHWKSFYLPLLMETGNKEKAFECVKALFADFWNKRRQLPDMTTTAENYLIAYANGFSKPEKSRMNWDLVSRVAETVAPHLRKLSWFWSIFFRKKYVR